MSSMKTYVYLHWIIIASVVMQLVSDITAGKLIQIGSIPVSVTVLYFPFTYLFADVLTEVYGYVEARKAVWIVLLASVVAGLLYQLVVFLPAATGFEQDEAYRIVLGSIPRILLGGWLAVWIGGMTNDYILAKMKIWTDGKHLWTRTIGSTLVGELANTATFYLIALAHILPVALLIPSILVGWLFKVGIEIVCTPITYRIIKYLKKAEETDVYDRETNFNPLRFGDGR